jgi:hypothetical protein
LKWLNVDYARLPGREFCTVCVAAGACEALQRPVGLHRLTVM